MDEFFSLCADIVGTSGPGGCLLSKVLETARKQRPTLVRAEDGAVSDWLLRGFRTHPELFTVKEGDDIEEPYVQASEALTHQCIGYSALEQAVRPPVTMRILYEIARTREDGILQSEVAKLVGLPPQTVHHHVLSLTSGRLITRERGVWQKNEYSLKDEDEISDAEEADRAAKRTAKSLTASVVLRLARFAEAEEDNLDNDEASALYTSSADVKALGERLLSSLREHPDKRMSMKELKTLILPPEDMDRQTDQDLYVRRRHRLFRRVKRDLLNEGKVVEEEHLVHLTTTDRKHVLGFLKLATDDVAAAASDVEAGDNRHTGKLMYAELDPLSLAWKIMVDRKEAGVTAPMLSRLCGQQIDRKFATVLLPQLEANEEVVKVTEHEGKQLILRYVHRDHLATDTRHGSDKESKAASPPKLKARMSTLSSTRQSRILERLKQQVVLRADKIGRMLAEAEGGGSERVDNKIIRRLLSHMQEQGLIQTIEVPQPGFAGRPVMVQLVTEPGIGPGSAEVEKFFVDDVQSRMEETKAHEVEKARLLDQPSIAIAGFPFCRDTKKMGAGFVRARLHGLLQGKMIRVRRLHEALFNYVQQKNLDADIKGRDRTFVVGDVLSQMSVDQFVKIIGVYDSIGTITPEERQLKILQLSDERRRALLRSRGATNQLLRLMDILKRMELIDNSVTIQTYELARKGVIRDFSGNNPYVWTHEVDLDRDEDIASYWAEVENLGNPASASEVFGSGLNGMSPRPVLRNIAGREPESDLQRPHFDVLEIYARRNWRTGRHRRLYPSEMANFEREFQRILRKRKRESIEQDSDEGVDIADLTVEDLYATAVSLKRGIGQIVAYYRHRLKNPAIAYEPPPAAPSSRRSSRRRLLVTEHRSLEHGGANATLEAQQLDEGIFPAREAPSYILSRTKIHRRPIQRRAQRTVWTSEAELRLLVNVVELKAERAVNVEPSRPQLDFWPEVGARMLLPVSTVRRRFSKLMQGDYVRYGVTEGIKRQQMHLANLQEPLENNRGVTDVRNEDRSTNTAFDARRFLVEVINGQSCPRMEEPEAAGFRLCRNVEKVREKYMFVPFSVQTSAASGPSTKVRSSLHVGRPARFLYQIPGIFFCGAPASGRRVYLEVPDGCKRSAQISHDLRSTVLRETIKALARTQSDEYDPEIGIKILSKFGKYAVHQAHDELRDSKILSLTKDVIHDRAYAPSQASRKSISDVVFHGRIHAGVSSFCSLLSAEDGGTVNSDSLTESDLLAAAQLTASNDCTFTPVFEEGMSGTGILRDMELLADRRSQFRAPQWRVDVARTADDFATRTMPVKRGSRADVPEGLGTFTPTASRSSRELLPLCGDVDLATRIFDVVCATGQDGEREEELAALILGPHPEECDKIAMDSLERTISELCSMGLVLRFHGEIRRTGEWCGSSWYIAAEHAADYCLDTLDDGGHSVRTPVRPWSKLDGKQDEKFLSDLYFALLSAVMEQPGVSLDNILSRFSSLGVPQGALVDVLSNLENEKRISSRILPEQFTPGPLAAEAWTGVSTGVMSRTSTRTYFPTLDVFSQDHAYLGPQP